MVRDARDTRCLIQRKQKLTAAASPATPLVCQGFRGLEHLGSTVPSLRQATDFFADVLGWPIVNAFTPTSDPPGDFLTGGLRLHPRAEVRDLAHVRTPLLNFELLEGTAPNQATNCHGCWTLVACAWRSTWKEIEAPDLPRLTGLSNIRRNQRFRRLGAGDQFIHLRTPIGMHLEFVTYPHGRHDHRDAAILTWNLVQPDDIARRALT